MHRTTPIYQKGQTRVQTGFLWWPKEMPNKEKTHLVHRWLETATWCEEYRVYHGLLINEEEWVPIHWEDCYDKN